jgi:hypothetical protein
MLVSSICPLMSDIPDNPPGIPGDRAECWFNQGIALKKIVRTGDGAACIDNGVNIAMGSG